MKPSEMIHQLEFLNKEISSIIDQLNSTNDSPQLLDIDLLNQKLITMYDLSLKLRDKLIKGDSAIETDESSLEYFRFEPGTGRFMFDTAETESETKSEKPEEIIPETEEVITITETPPADQPEIESALTAELNTEEEVTEKAEPVKEEAIVVPEPATTEIEEVVEPAPQDTSYWTVDKGWIGNKEPEIKPVPKEEIIEEKTEKVKDVVIDEPVVVNEIIPEPAKEEEKTTEIKKPIYESVGKTEKSLNELLASNKEKSVLNESQKVPFTDFKTAISLNLKISFIRELFQGNEKEYKKMIDFLTRCENFSEAKLYMQGEKEKHPEWESKQELLNHLQELINRKFH